MFKEPDNAFDSEAIKVVIKGIGTVGYIGNSPYTTAKGTMSAGRIYKKVKKKFIVEVMFITSSKVICRVVDGLKEKKVNVICDETKNESVEPKQVL